MVGYTQGSKQYMNWMLVSKISQIFLSVVVVLLILIQSKGKGLSADIGNTISMYRSRRGLEQIIFVLTIVFSVLIVVNSLLILYFS